MQKTEKHDALDQGQLAQMYKAKTRPLCHCQNPGIEMYIAKIMRGLLLFELSTDS